MAASNAGDAALRPLLLPTPPTWSQLSQHKQQLVALQAQVDAHGKLAERFDTITDEPTWNAFIPFGPLAYFPGQLIHTNDITHTLPVSSIESPSTSAITAPPASAEQASGDDWREDSASRVLKSAKQAKVSALRSAEDLKARIAELNVLIAQQEEEVKKEQAAQAVGGPTGSENWSFNDRGEVINEEGLPMFDIREELPAEQIQEIVEQPVEEVKEEQSKPQMRYLIKKGGKQVVKPLNVPSTSPSPATATTTRSPQSSVSKPSPRPPPSSTFEPSLDTKSILDKLEKEEEAGGELEKAQEGTEEQDASAHPAASAPPPIVQAAASSPTPSTSQSDASASSAPKPTKKPIKQFGGFSSGFLAKKPSAASPAAPKPSPSSSAPSTLSFPAPTACSTSASASITAIPSSTSDDPSAPHHEPLHHISQPAKSIYRPTPPPSAPGSPRPASPAVGHRVKFDVPSGEAPGDKEVSPTKAGKRRAIPLPPPPSAEEKAAGSNGEEKPKFERPIKDKVVEREVKPPTAPGGPRKERDQTSRSKEERDRYLKTLGRPPKVKERLAEEASRATASAPTPTPAPKSAPTATPIHTISLSAKKKPTSSLAGEMSIAEIPSDDSEDEEAPEIGMRDEEHDDDEPSQPSLTRDGDSDGESSSSGFYGSEDDDSDEEIDIDAALHAREVALAYHDRRMGVGAGAGTGPLGGSGDPEAFDSWNQPDVPIDATLQGRPVSHGASSRFRTGRLESAQMIIPSLLAEHVKEDGQPSSDEEEDAEGRKDGLTRDERERLRRSLEAIGRGEMPEPVEIGAAAGGVKEVVEKSKQVVREKAPPQVIATPISVPSNAPMRKEERLPAAPAPLAPGDKPKKMSRFKARQMGLDPDE